MKYELNIDAAISKDGLNPGLYPVIIYQLVKQYSCEGNPITINDIEDTLSAYWKGDKEKGSTKSNLHRTIKRNLQSLLYFDSNIHAEFSDHTVFNIESDTAIGKIKYLWYEQDLSTADLQILSNSLVYSKHLEKETRLDLIKKLLCVSGYSSTHKENWVSSLIQDSEDYSVHTSPSLYRNLGFIYDAIKQKNCLSFEYNHSKLISEENNERRFCGFSPYKIIQNQGIFFVIGSTIHNDPNIFDIYRHKGLPFPILQLAVHRISKINTDFSHNYLDIEETEAEGKDILYFIGSAYNLYTSKLIPVIKKEKIVLQVDEFGLDTITDLFDNRITLREIEPKKFEIKIYDFVPVEWESLISVLLRHPRHISFISPKEHLREILSIIEPQT